MQTDLHFVFEKDQDSNIYSKNSKTNSKESQKTLFIYITVRLSIWHLLSYKEAYGAFAVCVSLYSSWESNLLTPCSSSLEDSLSLCWCVWAVVRV